MSSNTRIRVEGLNDARRDLQQFDIRLRERFVRDALRNAATIMRRAIIAAAPKRDVEPAKRRTTLGGAIYGPTRRSISTIAPRPRGDVQRVVIRTKTKKRDAFYARFIEGGFKHRGGKIVAPEPFARPAATRAYDATMARFRELLQQRIAREVARR